MSNADTFANARIKPYGSVRGGDDEQHDVFVVQTQDNTILYGNYSYVHPSKEVTTFNIEIGGFGYLRPDAVGDPGPHYRRRLTAHWPAAGSVDTRLS